MIIIISKVISMKLCSFCSIILWYISSWINDYQTLFIIIMNQKTKIEISARFGHFSISSWKQKGHKPSWKSFISSYGSSQLSSGSSLLTIEIFLRFIPRTFLGSFNFWNDRLLLAWDGKNHLVWSAVHAITYFLFLFRSELFALG